MPRVAHEFPFVIIFTDYRSWEEDLHLFEFLPESITPWLLGGLFLLALFALSATFKSWRESKRSPYFFLRMQAGKKMQRYMAMSLVLVLMAAVASAYAWQAPVETTEQVSVLKHAKPNPQIYSPVEEAAPASEEEPKAVTMILTPAPEQAATFSVKDLPSTDDLLEVAEAAAGVTEETSAVEAETGSASDGSARLGDISFSLDISGNYQAVEPGRQFVEGFYTLYATFNYSGMTDGMNWAWSWLRNGAQIEGGNQVWNYGQDGPGYIYFQPEEGFRSGEYSLAIWVDDELQSQSSFTIANGVAASN